MAKVVSASDSNISEVHQAKVHEFSDSAPCPGKGAIRELSGKFTDKWSQQSTVKCGSDVEGSKVTDCTFHVSPAMQMVAAMREQVSTRRDASGYGSKPETYSHSIILMDMITELEVSPTVHCSDQANFRNATVVRDCAGRFRPGYWIFVGAGSEKTWQFHKWDKPDNIDGNWDRKI